MTIQTTRRLRALLFTASALAGASLAGGALAQTAAAQPASDEVIVTVSRTTRSAVELAGPETQKILPGISPLKAIESLPGVVYETADPWGNNEQNETLYIHGFSLQQLGYTMDGVPLGDQQYGNYNGLSTSRAVTSKNVGRVVLESGAGSLGVASTSNLGGAIETFSNDPAKAMGLDLRETAGSYSTTRTFARFDTGDILGGYAYGSYLHHDAVAWDFDGHQRDDQANLKYVRDDVHGKLTLFADWDSKVEPNEDSICLCRQPQSGAAAASFTPSTRAFIYPNIAGLQRQHRPLRSAFTANLAGHPARRPLSGQQLLQLLQRRPARGRPSLRQVRLERRARRRLVQPGLLPLRLQPRHRRRADQPGGPAGPVRRLLPGPGGRYRRGCCGSQPDQRRDPSEYRQCVWRHGQ